MDLHTKGLDVVGTVCTAGEVGKIELNLVPSLVKSHWHRTDERFHTRSGLVITCAETTAHILVIQYLYLESEVFLQLKI